jgi:hypothetical protein
MVTEVLYLATMSTNTKTEREKQHQFWSKVFLAVIVMPFAWLLSVALAAPKP